METLTIINYTILVALIVASPGPDSLLIINHTLARGRANGFAVLGGVQVGVATHAFLSVVGISTILYHSKTLFSILVIVGPMYLVWLGVQSIIKHDFLTRGDSLPTANDESQATQKSKTARGGGSLLLAARKGMLCNLLNPKVLILFVVLMPAYVNTDASAAVSTQTQLVVLALILLAINIPFQSLLIVLSEKVRHWLQNPRLLRRVQVALGGALIFMAGSILLEHGSELLQ